MAAFIAFDKNAPLSDRIGVMFRSAPKPKLPTPHINLHVPNNKKYAASIADSTSSSNTAIDKRMSKSIRSVFGKSKSRESTYAHSIAGDVHFYEDNRSIEDVPHPTAQDETAVKSWQDAVPPTVVLTEPYESGATHDDMTSPNTQSSNPYEFEPESDNEEIDSQETVALAFALPPQHTMHTQMAGKPEDFNHPPRIEVIQLAVQKFEPREPKIEEVDSDEERDQPQQLTLANEAQSEEPSAADLSSSSRDSGSTTESLRTLERENKHQIGYKPFRMADPKTTVVSKANRVSIQTVKKDTVKKRDSLEDRPQELALPSEAPHSFMPPPFFKGLADAIKHAQLPTCVLSADSIIQMSTHSKNGEYIDPLSADRKSEKARAKHRKLVSEAISKAEWTQKIYVLVANGYILQYTVDGTFNRLPEKVVQLGKESSAFASDVIPGKHWVLQISHVADPMTPPPSETAEARKSRRRSSFQRQTEENAVSTNVLLVLDSGEELDIWLNVVRHEIELVGGKKAGSETGSIKIYGELGEDELANLRPSPGTLTDERIERYTKTLARQADERHLSRSTSSFENDRNSWETRPHSNEVRIEDSTSEGTSCMSPDERMLNSLRDSDLFGHSRVPSDAQTALTAPSRASSSDTSIIKGDFTDDEDETSQFIQSLQARNGAALKARRASVQNKASVKLETSPPAGPRPSTSDGSTATVKSLRTKDKRQSPPLAPKTKVPVQDELASEPATLSPPMAPPRSQSPKIDHIGFLMAQSLALVEQPSPAPEVAPVGEATTERVLTPPPPPPRSSRRPLSRTVSTTSHSTTSSYRTAPVNTRRLFTPVLTTVDSNPVPTHESGLTPIPSPTTSEEEMEFRYWNSRLQNAPAPPSEAHMRSRSSLYRSDPFDLERALQSVDDDISEEELGTPGPPPPPVPMSSYPYGKVTKEVTFDEGAPAVINDAAYDAESDYDPNEPGQSIEEASMVPLPLSPAMNATAIARANQRALAQRAERRLSYLQTHNEKRDSFGRSHEKRDSIGKTQRRSIMKPTPPKPLAARKLIDITSTDSANVNLAPPTATSLSRSATDPHRNSGYGHVKGSSLSRSASNKQAPTKYTSILVTPPIPTHGSAHPAANSPASRAEKRRSGGKLSARRSLQVKDERHVEIGPPIMPPPSRELPGVPGRAPSQKSASSSDPSVRFEDDVGRRW